MIGGVLAKRYAKALFDSLSEERIEIVRKDLDAFQDMFKISPEIGKLLLSPIFELEEKKNIIQLLSERAGFSKESRRFFDLLLEKDRLKYLKEIRTLFEALIYERSNKVKAYVISCDSLSPSYEAELRGRLKQLTNKEVDLDIKTDPSIIGGMVIRIDDMIYDGSIKGHLKGIKDELLGGIAKD